MADDFVNTLGENEELSEDVKKKLSSIFEKYQQMSDEEKEEFHKGAYDVLAKSVRELSNNSILPTWLVPYQSYIPFISAMSIVAFLLGTTSLALSDFVSNNTMRANTSVSSNLLITFGKLIS